MLQYSELQYNKLAFRTFERHSGEIRCCWF